MKNTLNFIWYKVKSKIKSKVQSMVKSTFFIIF